MKTIATLKQAFRNLLGLTQNKPQLIAITQTDFCNKLDFNDYYCNENNLFI